MEPTTTTPVRGSFDLEDIKLQVTNFVQLSSSDPTRKAYELQMFRWIVDNFPEVYFYAIDVLIAGRESGLLRGVTFPERDNRTNMPCDVKAVQTISALGLSLVAAECDAFISDFVLMTPSRMFVLGLIFGTAQVDYLLIAIESLGIRFYDLPHWKDIPQFGAVADPSGQPFPFVLAPLSWMHTFGSDRETGIATGSCVLTLLAPSLEASFAFHVALQQGREENMMNYAKWRKHTKVSWASIASMEEALKPTEKKRRTAVLLAARLAKQQMRESGLGTELGHPQIAGLGSLSSAFTGLLPELTVHHEVSASPTLEAMFVKLTAIVDSLSALKDRTLDVATSAVQFLLNDVRVRWTLVALTALSFWMAARKRSATWVSVSMLLITCNPFWGQTVMVKLQALIASGVDVITKWADVNIPATPTWATVGDEVDPFLGHPEQSAFWSDKPGNDREFEIWAERRQEGWLTSNRNQLSSAWAMMTDTERAPWPGFSAYLGAMWSVAKTGPIRDSYIEASGRVPVEPRNAPVDFPPPAQEALHASGSEDPYDLPMPQVSLPEVADAFKAVAKITEVLVAYAVPLLSGAASFKPGALIKMMSLFANLDRSIEGFNKFVGFVKAGIEAIVNWLRTTVLGVKRIRMFPVGVDVVDEWITAVDAIVEERDLAKLPMILETYKRMSRLRMQGDLILREYQTALASGVVRDIVTRGMQRLRPIQEMLAMSNLAGSQIRMEPLSICVVGDSGVGKTKMAIPLVEEVMAKVLEGDELKRFRDSPYDQIYQRMPEHEYWDGYKGQKATIFDDFMQGRDVAGSPDSEAMSLIRVVGPFPYFCHMADLNQKGTTLFTSDIVYASSNHRKLNPQSVHFPEAVVRRFDLTYECVILDEYRKNDGTPTASAVDVKKVKAVYGDHFTTEIYRFQPVNLYTGEPGEGDILTYDQLVEKAVEGYKAKNHVADQFLSDVRVRREIIVDARMEEDADLVDIDSSVIDKFLADTSTARCSRAAGVVDDGEGDLIWEEVEAAFDDESPCAARSTAYRRCCDPAVYLAQLRSYEAGAPLWKVIQKRMVRSMAVNPFLHMGGGAVDMLFSIEAKLSRQFKDYAKRTMRWTTEQHEKALSKFADLPTWNSWVEEAYRLGQVVKTYADDCEVHAKEFTRNFFVKCRELITGMTGFLASGLTQVAMGLAAISAGYAFFEYMRCTGVEATEFFPTVPNSHPEWSAKNSIKAARERGRARRNHKQDVAKPQAGFELPRCVKAESTTDSFMEAVTNKNCYEIVGANGNSIGRMMFVRGRHALVPLHYYCYFKDVLEGHIASQAPYNLVNKIADKLIAVEPTDFMNPIQTEELDEKDLCLVHLPQASLHKDRLDSFVDEKEIRGIDRWSVGIYSLNGNSVYRDVTDATLLDKQACRDFSGSIYELSNLVTYRSQLKVGHCGTLVAIQTANPRSGRILAVHVAGTASSHMGMGSVVTKQTLERAFKDERCVNEVLPFPQGGEKVSYEMPGMEVIGHLPEFPYRSTRTSIFSTRLLGELGPVTKGIARQKPFKGPGGEMIYPMKNALSKYAHEPVHIDEGVLRMATDDLKAFVFSSGMRAEMPGARILTFEEAIKGAPDLDFVPSMPRDTSPGWPFNLPSVNLSKKDLFGEGDEIDLDNPNARMLRKMVEDVLEQADNGEELFLPFTGMTKDERRPLAKVAEGKTRYVSAGSLLSYITSKMYVGHFLGCMQKHNLALGVGIGLNPFGAGWHVIAMQLRSRNPKKAGDGDFVTFDACATAQLRACILELVNEWYRQKGAARRKALWKTTDNSIHIVDGVLLRWLGGMPSGHFFTAGENCLINLLDWRIVWYIIMGDDPETAYPMDHWVKVVVMGDDNIINVHPQVADRFTPEAIRDAFALIGYTYTAADKKSVENMHKPLEECTFLKRGFRFEESLRRYIGPLDLETIMDIPCWRKKGQPEELAVRENVDTAIRELALHDDETYLRLATLLRDKCRDVYGIDVFIPARRALVRAVCDVE